MTETVILGVDGNTRTVKVPTVKAVHPFGSKILVEVIGSEELLETDLFVPEGSESGDAPQAYIVELGPQLDETCGLAVGQRIYWEGKGLAVNDPRSKSSGRIMALLEVHNIRAVIEEND